MIAIRVDGVGVRGSLDTLAARVGEIVPPEARGGDGREQSVSLTGGYARILRHATEELDLADLVNKCHTAALDGGVEHKFRLCVVDDKGNRFVAGSK